ncbi:hypothetical protein KEJ21_03565 [Candidatus Bathyarchaeota archaeon]|nr:hypothetical protein [Candidatus Bathyarchaeota archaeon]MBS7631055.1 hypothetical protein [Candidatus Bathyarchaeota archaeon]
MNEVVVTLISARTIEQGIGLEIGKTSEQYQNSVSVIELNPSDFESLEISEGETVEVESDYGSVLVKCRSSQDVPKGRAFMPYGPWANKLFSSSTRCSGMPQLKGIKVRVKAAKGLKMPSIVELIDELRRL